MSIDLILLFSYWKCQFTIHISSIRLTYISLFDWMLSNLVFVRIHTLLLHKIKLYSFGLPCKKKQKYFMYVYRYYKNLVLFISLGNAGCSYCKLDTLITFDLFIEGIGWWFKKYAHSPGHHTCKRRELPLQSYLLRGAIPARLTKSHRIPHKSVCTPTFTLYYY